MLNIDYTSWHNSNIKRFHNKGTRFGSIKLNINFPLEWKIKVANE